MKRALRPLGILLAVVLVSTVVFSGAALADNTNNQESDQNAATFQDQDADAANVAVAAGSQSNDIDQDADADINRDSDQYQCVDQYSSEDNDFLDLGQADTLRITSRGAFF